jgi:nicotinamide-nucleotide amidase
VCGLGESSVNDRIADIIHEGGNPSIGTLASLGDIRIRIMARGRRPSEAKSLIEGVESRIRERLGDLIYGMDYDTLEGVVAKLLEKIKLTLSTSEPYTGGLCAQRLWGTESPQFLGGVVLNSDEAARLFLGLEMAEYTGLKRNGRGCALRLAEKTRERYQSDLGLSICGFSEGGGPKQRGQIKARLHIGIISDGMKRVVDHHLGGPKRMVQERAAIFALDCLRKDLSNMIETK